MYKAFLETFNYERKMHLKTSYILCFEDDDNIKIRLKRLYRKSSASEAQDFQELLVIYYSYIFQLNLLLPKST